MVVPPARGRPETPDRARVFARFLRQLRFAAFRGPDAARSKSAPHDSLDRDSLAEWTPEADSNQGLAQPIQQRVPAGLDYGIHPKVRGSTPVSPADKAAVSCDRSCE